jgi:hypothetical protein
LGTGGAVIAQVLSRIIVLLVFLESTSDARRDAACRLPRTRRRGSVRTHRTRHDGSTWTCAPGPSAARSSKATCGSRVNDARGEWMSHHPTRSVNLPSTYNFTCSDIIRLFRRPDAARRRGALLILIARADCTRVIWAFYRYDARQPVRAPYTYRAYRTQYTHRVVLVATGVDRRRALATASGPYGIGAHSALR